MTGQEMVNFMCAELAVGSEGLVPDDYDWAAEFNLPAAAAIPPGEWVPAPRGSYCPVTFNEAFVPAEVCASSALGACLVVAGVLYVIVGHRGPMGLVAYFKFTA